MCQPALAPPLPPWPPDKITCQPDLFVRAHYGRRTFHRNTFYLHLRHGAVMLLNGESENDSPNFLKIPRLKHFLRTPFLFWQGKAGQCTDGSPKHQLWAFAPVSTTWELIAWPADVGLKYTYWQRDAGRILPLVFHLIMYHLEPILVPFETFLILHLKLAWASSSSYFYKLMKLNNLIQF